MTQRIEAFFDEQPIISAEYVLDPGISASAGYAELSPDAFQEIKRNLFRDNHKLSLSAGDQKVEITDLHVNSIEQSHPRAPVKIHFQDRRWKWEKFGGVVEDINVLDEAGLRIFGKDTRGGWRPFTIDPATNLPWSVESVVHLMLKKMGEKEAKVPALDYLPTSIRLHGHRPAKVIQELISRSNIQISLNSKGGIVFFKRDPHAVINFPEAFKIDEPRAQAFPAIPDKIKLIGSRIRDQETTICEPVFIRPPLDWEAKATKRREEWKKDKKKKFEEDLPVVTDPNHGTIVALDSDEGLTFFGFESSEEANVDSAGDFNAVKDRRGLEIWRIAKQFLFKWWRIKGDETDIKRGWKLWKQTPILKNLNSVIETEGRLQRAPVRLTSSYVCPDPDPKTIAEHVKVDRAWLQDTSLAQRKHGIVITSERTGVWPSNYGKGKNVAGLTQSAKFRDQVWLTYAWELKGTEDIEDAFFVYEFDNPNPLPKVAKKKEGEKDILWITSRDLIQIKIDGKDQNIEALEKLCNLFCVDYFQQLFAQQKGGSVKLAGFFDYSPGPSIDSVRWSVSSGGAFTIINWGYQHSAMAGLPSPEERIREALVKKNMFIEGDEPYCRKTGQDDEAGAGDFETSNDIQSGDAKRKALGIQNAHHSGPLPMIDKEAGTEDVLFCRVPETDPEKHLHAIDQLGPLLTAPPDGEEAEPRKDWRWVKCPIWFEPKEGHHGADGYWFPWVKVPPDVELAEVTEIINPAIPPGSTLGAPQVFPRSSKQQKRFEEKVKGKLKEPRNKEEWLKNRKIVLDATNEVIDELGAPVGLGIGAKILGETLGPRWLFPTQGPGGTRKMTPIDLNRLPAPRVVGGWDRIGLKEPGKTWQFLNPLPADEQEEKEDSLWADKKKKLKAKTEENKKQIKKIADAIKNIDAQIKYESGKTGWTKERKDELEEKKKEYQEQIVKLLNENDKIATKIKNKENDVPVYSGPYLKANKIEEPPVLTPPDKPGPRPEGSGNPGKEITVIVTGEGGIPEVPNHKVGDVIPVFQTGPGVGGWRWGDIDPGDVYITPQGPNLSPPGATTKIFYNDSPDTIEIGASVSPDAASDVTDAMRLTEPGDPVSFAVLSPAPGYDLGVCATAGQSLRGVRGIVEPGDMLAPDTTEPGQLVVVPDTGEPVPSDAVATALEPTPEGTGVNGVNRIHTIPVSTFGITHRSLSTDEHLQYFPVDASRVITGDTTIEKTAPVTLTLVEAGGGGTLDLIRDVGEISLLADIYKPGALGNQLDFGGTNEYVKCGNVLGFEYNLPFSVGTWGTTAVTGRGTLVSKMTAASVGWEIFVASYKVYVYIIQTFPAKTLAVVTTSAVLTSGVTHRVLVTYDGSNTAGGITVYVDGDPKALTTLFNNPMDGTIANAAELNFGRRGTAYYLIGKQDEINIWDKELSSAEATADYAEGAGVYLVPGANRVGIWHLDESSGTNAPDTSGNNYHGTLVNMEDADWVVGLVTILGAVNKVPVLKASDGVDPGYSVICELGDTAGYLLFHGEVVQDIDFDNIAGITKLGFLEIESLTPYADLIDLADGEKSRFSVDSGQPTQTAQVYKPGDDISRVFTLDADFDITGAGGLLEKNDDVSLVGSPVVGGLLAESCDNFDAPWTEFGVAGNAYSEISPAGQFHLVATAATEDRVGRFHDVGVWPDDGTIEFRIKFDSMGNSATANQYVQMAWYNGIILLIVKWGTDGIRVYDGASDVLVDATNFADGNEHIFRFVIDGGVADAAVCEIWADGALLVAAADCSMAYGSNDGRIDFDVRSPVSGTLSEIHVDWINVDTGLVTPPFSSTMPSAKLIVPGQTYSVYAGADQVIDAQHFSATTSGVIEFRHMQDDVGAWPGAGWSAWMNKAALDAAMAAFDDYKYGYIEARCISDSTFDSVLSDATVTAVALGAVVTRNVVGAFDAVQPGVGGNVFLGDSTNPDHRTQVWGATDQFSYQIDAKTANYTLTATDYLITVDATGGNVTITLPTVVGIPGREYIIKRIDSSANIVTIDADGAETIDEETTQPLPVISCMQIVSDGTSNWNII